VADVQEIDDPQATAEEGAPVLIIGVVGGAIGPDPDLILHDDASIPQEDAPTPLADIETGSQLTKSPISVIVLFTAPN